MIRVPTPLLKWLLRRQLDAARRSGLLDLLVRGAMLHDLKPAYVLAIASRETGIRNLLGDGGHGVGVMQIDIRHHYAARSAKARGDWRSLPWPLVGYGCRLLSENVGWARETWPSYTALQHLKLAAAAYNAGREGCKRGAATGDCDRYTTGRDYGRDVLRRMGLFAALLAEVPEG